jgi:hypothetical protein
MSGQSSIGLSLKCVLVGGTGAGKSQFGLAASDGKASFVPVCGTNAGTVKPMTCTFNFPNVWVQKMKPIKGLDLPSLVWKFTDTPGIEDPLGPDVDEKNICSVVDHLQQSQENINVIALVMPIHSARFTPAVQKMFKVFDVFFNDPKTWDRVCIVATSVHPGIEQDQRDVFIRTTSVAQPCMRDRVINLLHQLHDWGGKIPEFPVFFVDSRHPHGPTESEFLRFFDWGLTRISIPINPSGLGRLNLSVMRSIPDTREEIKDVRLLRRRAGGSGRRIQVGTRRVKCPKVITKRVSCPRVEDRPLDWVDVCTLGIARLFRVNRVQTVTSKEETETVDNWIDEPVYESEYVHVERTRFTKVRTITWDFTADLPIKYQADFDKPERGRITGPWGKETSEVLKQWDENP